MSGVELRQLRYFAEVARAGTYLAAAARLRVAQPALWKQVKALEREMGVALFERSGRRVRLTRPGSVLLERCEVILDAADRLGAAADDLRTGRTGLVTVACVYPHVQRVLARAVGHLSRSHPGIRVELVERSVPDPLGELAAGRADVVTTFHQPGASGFKLYDVRVVAVVPANHRWRGRARLPVEQLREMPLLTPPEGFFSRTRLEEACRAAGFEPRIAAESTSPLALLALGEEGVSTTAEI